MKKLYKKYEELINYIIVGFATTVVYLIACLIFKLFWDPEVVIENVLINTFGWLVGVIFAYFTNRAFVFKSKNPNMWAEFIKFTAGRLLTWGLDVFLMWLFVNVWNLSITVFGYFIESYWVGKFISCVLVMIANYVISKLIVFSKKKEVKEENE